MILWESLSPEDQEKCLTELQSDTHWVIWCKAKPRDMATQTFREYGKCTFVGKCAKQKQVDDNQTNMHCWVHQDTLFNGSQVETNMREAWEHESSKDEMNIVLDGVLRLPGRNLGRGWIVKQRRYGGRL